MESWTASDVAELLAELEAIKGLVEVGAIALCAIAGVFLLRMVILGKNQRSLFAAALVLGVGASAHAYPLATVTISWPNGSPVAEFPAVTYRNEAGIAGGIVMPLYKAGDSWFGVYKYKQSDGDVYSWFIEFKLEGGQPWCRLWWGDGSGSKTLSGEDFEYQVQYQGGTSLSNQQHTFKKTYATLAQGEAQGQVRVDIAANGGLFDGGGSGSGLGFPPDEEFDHEATDDAVTSEQETNMDRLKTILNSQLPALTLTDPGNPSDINFSFGYTPPQGATLSGVGGNRPFNLRAAPGSALDLGRITARAIFILLFSLLFVQGILQTVKRW